MSLATVAAHGFRINGAGYLELGGIDALVLARDFGTPLHVLDEGRLRANCAEYRDTLAQAYGRNARAIFASKACCIVATCQIAHQEGLGIAAGAAYRAVVRPSRMPRVRLRGLHAHIGSQVFDLEPFRMSAEALVDFAARIRDELDVTVEELNLGGGLGIRYLTTDEPPSITDYVRALADVVTAKVRGHRLSPPRLSVEPGRSIVGSAGVTLYTVGAIKSIPGVRTYVAVDGGMFENPRSALYGAHYEAVAAARAADAATDMMAVAGPCFASREVLDLETRLPPFGTGDLLAVFWTGAVAYSIARHI